MTISHPKLEILQSLNHLDAPQSEKVLEFIKVLIQRENDRLTQRDLKRRAMAEIGQALRQSGQTF